MVRPNFLIEISDKNHSIHPLHFYLSFYENVLNIHWQREKQKGQNDRNGIFRGRGEGQIVNSLLVLQSKNINYQDKTIKNAAKIILKR